MKMIRLNIRTLRKIGNRGEDLFLIAWSLMVIHMYIAYSSLSVYSNSVVSMIGFALFCFKILRTKYTVKEIVICGFFMCVGILTIEPTQDMRIFWFAVTIFALKNVNIERVIKVTYRITIVCCVLFFIAYISGISTDEIIYLDNGHIRHGFGLGHPNMLQAYILYIVSMTVYLNYAKLKGYILIILFSITFVFYYFTYSRTGIIVTVAVLIMAWLIRFFQINKMVSYGVLITTYIYIGAFSLLPIVYYKYRNSLFIMLNSLLTNRISQAAYLYNAYGVRLFGFRPVELIFSRRYLYSDMGYATMLICYGLIYYIIIVGCMMILVFQYTKRKNYGRLLLLSSFALFLGTENVATYIFLNVSMLFISELIFSTRNKQE